MIPPVLTSIRRRGINSGLHTEILTILLKNNPFVYQVIKHQVLSHLLLLLQRQMRQRVLLHRILVFHHMTLVVRRSLIIIMKNTYQDTSISVKKRPPQFKTTPHTNYRLTRRLSQVTKWLCLKRMLWLSILLEKANAITLLLLTNTANTFSSSAIDSIFLWVKNSV